MRRQALRMVVVLSVSVFGCVSAYAGLEDARTWEEDFETDPRLNTDDWQARGGGPSQAQFALENGMAVWDGSAGWDTTDSVDHYFNGVTTIQMDWGAHPGDGSVDDRGVGWFLLAGNSSETSGTTGMLLASWALAMDADGQYLDAGGEIDGGDIDPIYVAEGPVSATVKMTVLPEDEGGEVEYSVCDSVCAAGGPPITGNYLQLNRDDFSDGEKGFTFTNFGPGLGAIDYLKVVNDPNPIGTGLQAGDADQDLDFDQFDLIMVQVAAKYMSGEAATWGEGDWDAAPGGEQGSPPPGNGLFDQFDIIAALNNNLYLMGPYGAIAGGGNTGDGQTSVVYDVSTGEVSVDGPTGQELTSINIDSAAGIFTGDAAANLGGSFDNDADTNIFKATFGSSFGSLSFGNVAQPGLAQDFLLNDLTVVGSLAGGGDLGNVDLVYVPEPATMLLLIGGVLALVSTIRCRRLS